MGTVVHIDEERIKDHLGRIVRGTVEDTLNALLDAEADRLLHHSHVLTIRGDSYRLKEKRRSGLLPKTGTVAVATAEIRS